MVSCRRVSFEVEGVTAEELFREIVKDLPVEIKYNGPAIELRPVQ